MEENKTYPYPMIKLSNSEQNFNEILVRVYKSFSPNEYLTLMELYEAKDGNGILNFFLELLEKSMISWMETFTGYFEDDTNKIKTAIANPVSRLKIIESLKPNFNVENIIIQENLQLDEPIELPLLDQHFEKELQRVGATFSRDGQGNYEVKFEGELRLDELVSLPTGTTNFQVNGTIIFSNTDFVYLKSNTNFFNDGDVIANYVEQIGDGVIFQNTGDVVITGIKSLTGQIIFKNKGEILSNETVFVSDELIKLNGGNFFINMLVKNTSPKEIYEIETIFDLTDSFKSEINLEVALKIQEIIADKSYGFAEDNQYQYRLKQDEIVIGVGSLTHDQYYDISRVVQEYAMSINTNTPVRLVSKVMDYLGTVVVSHEKLSVIEEIVDMLGDLKQSDTDENIENVFKQFGSFGEEVYEMWVNFCKNLTTYNVVSENKNIELNERYGISIKDVNKPTVGDIVDFGEGLEKISKVANGWIFSNSLEGLTTRENLYKISDWKDNIIPSQERYKQNRLDQEQSRIEREKNDALVAEKETKEKELFENTHGFADKFPNMKRGAILKTLNTQGKFNGDIMSRKEYIEKRISESENPTVKDGRLFFDETTFMDSKNLTQTGIDYTEYLISINFGKDGSTNTDESYDDTQQTIEEIEDKQQQIDVTDTKEGQLIPTNEKVAVENYPYGYTLKTTLYDSVEFSEKKGYRTVKQTINPKTNKLNAPKKSTYSDLIVRKYDENGHIKNTHFSISSSDVPKLIKVADFVTTNFDFFTKEEIVYLYMTFFTGLKINLSATITYNGAKLEDVKPIIDSAIKACVEGIKNPTENYFVEFAKIDVDAYNATKDPNFNPFKIN